MKLVFEVKFLMDIDKAVKFLHSQYDEEVGLLREAPTVQPNWFWLNIDNELTLDALLYIDDRDKFGLKIFSNVNSYQPFEKHGRQEILYWNKKAKFPFTWPNKITVKVIGDKIVKNETTLTSNAKIEGWTNYADLLFLAIIHFLNEPSSFWDKLRAKFYFSKAMRMWDGYGFNDTIAKQCGHYATYKLALFMIAAKKMKSTSMEAFGLAREIISMMQSESEGGIYTDYTKTFLPVSNCDMNTETTAHCMIAELCEFE